MSDFRIALPKCQKQPVIVRPEGTEGAQTRQRAIKNGNAQNRLRGVRPVISLFPLYHLLDRIVSGLKADGRSHLTRRYWLPSSSTVSTSTGLMVVSIGSVCR